MKWYSPRKDFYVAEDYFSREVAQGYLKEILHLGEDALKGFKHPDLKANRFHLRPKYPVSHYMCFGLYWSPLDYFYHLEIPDQKVKPWEIPDWLTRECVKLVKEKFPHHKSWRAETTLVNFYQASKKMGWHVDKEEKNHTAPVVGINFGSSARFYFEDEEKSEKSFILPANSVYLFGDSARMMRHAVGAGLKKTLSPESHGLLREGERLNLTVRQVSP
ncbi:MAG: alpha-ketoglutarate-dependent dioxygenase AlkB [Bacteriovoracaceae bacterium]|nr:alpha-ketoglutarate-dependent dioxygenase AlkB [Bacteriovoracaceae bacterium]